MLPRFSLRALLLALIFASTTVMMLPHLVWEYFTAIDVARDTMTEQLMAIGHIISRDVESGFLNRSDVLVDEQVRNALLISHMLSANVVDYKDIVLHSSDRGSVGKVFSDFRNMDTMRELATSRATMAATSHLNAADNRICAIFPFDMASDGNFMQPTAVGAVILEMSMDSSVSAAKSYFINSATFSLLIAFVTSILVWVVFQKTFISELGRLLRSAVLYGSEGRVPEPLQLQTVELAAIDDVFVRMSRLLEDRQLQLRSSEERYRRLFEMSSDGLIMADGRDGLDSFRVLEVNESFTQMTGVERLGESAGSSLAEILPCEFKAILSESLASSNLSNAPIVRDIALIKFNGEQHFVRIWGYLDRLETGVVRLFLRVLDTDADRRREILQRQISEMHEASVVELERVGRLKDDFLANMSHELRTPLHGILGACDILEDDVFGELTPKQREMVAISKQSARHLLSVINGILDLAKIEAGKFNMEFDVNEPGVLCDEVYSIVLPLAQRQRIQIDVNYQEALGSQVFVDATRVRQVLLNLLSNAIQHTPVGGKVILQCRFNEEERAVLFEVIDRGCGIDTAKLATLFNPFEQVSTGLSRSENGTGLGLALVEKLVKLHLGHVIVSSAPGAGSRFGIVLPDSKFIQSIIEHENQSTPPVDLPALTLDHADAIILDSFRSRALALVAALHQKGFTLVVCNSILELPGLLVRFRPEIIFVELDRMSRGIADLVEADRSGLLSMTRIVGISNFIIDSDSDSEHLKELYNSDIDLSAVVAQPFSPVAIANLMQSFSYK